ncbi:Pkinase-domain-containing protein [Lentinula raphanica]|uniref:non-specific serine/threonine protein kinase n=1 Tax=Lentinula raphanica TaxID=153919 RepID=A0AA38P1S9_9AGAR|nr:Pkinase-domain-containing protein [Lentinula raphanica]KAJ3968114.1 Pkinase-domain-containing protein [Lentinula raphanica]
MDHLSSTLTNLKDQAKDALWALSAGWSSCVMCQQEAKVKINGRTFKILKVLGEGGFSFVYLAQDEGSGRQFALKKIRCPTGNDGVKEAMREVEAYRRFRHPNIIRILDSAVVQDDDGEGKVVYLFLPLYQRGNVQDLINAHLINHSHFSELEMIKLFKGTCEAVRAMHEWRPTKGSKKGKGTNANRNRRANGVRGSSSQGRPNGNASNSHGGGGGSGDEDDDHRFPEPEGDAEGGYSYGPSASLSKNKPSRSASGSVPLINRDEEEGLMGGNETGGEVLFDGDEDVAGIDGEGGAGEEGEIVPYAHRDIKPGNVMISDEGRPILMDFGSTMRARIKIENRSMALYQQDIAAEQSTMAYRAPELFDVKTGTMLDEKVDIWSLGCLLFAMAYSHSPFENTQTTEQGGSIAMAVLNAQYKHPRGSEGRYSNGLKEMIDRLLKVDPGERPGIGEVLAMCESVERKLR